jgi:WD40 repeat protein
VRQLEQQQHNGLRPGLSETCVVEQQHSNRGLQSPTVAARESHRPDIITSVQANAVLEDHETRPALVDNVTREAVATEEALHQSQSPQDVQYVETPSTPPTTDDAALVPASTASQQEAPQVQQLLHQPLAVLPKIKGRLLDIIFSPNNKFFVVTCLGGPTKLWKVQQSNCRHLLTIDHVQVEGHENTAVFSQDSEILAMRIRGARFGLWDTRTPKRKKLIDQGVSIIKHLAVSPNNKKIAAIQERMTHASMSQHTTLRTKYTGLSGALDLRLWDTASGKPVHTFELTTLPPVRRIWFSPDSKLICSQQKLFWNPAVWPEVVLTWGISSRELVSEFPIPCSYWAEGRKSTRKDMIVSPDFATVTCVDVVSAENQTIVSSWNIVGTAVEHRASYAFGGICECEISQDGEWVAVLRGELSNIVLVYATATDIQHVLSFQSNNPNLPTTAYRMVFSPSGRFIALRTSWLIRAWEVDTGRVVLDVLSPHGTIAYAIDTLPISFSPDGCSLITEDVLEHKVKVWKMNAPQFALKSRRADRL